LVFLLIALAVGPAGGRVVPVLQSFRALPGAGRISITDFQS